MEAERTAGSFPHTAPHQDTYSVWVVKSRGNDCRYIYPSSCSGLYNFMLSRPSELSLCYFMVELEYSSSRRTSNDEPSIHIPEPHRLTMTPIPIPSFGLHITEPSPRNPQLPELPYYLLYMSRDFNNALISLTE